MKDAVLSLLFFGVFVAWGALVWWWTQR